MKISEIEDMTHTIENTHEKSVDFRSFHYSGLSGAWLTAETAALDSLERRRKVMRTFGNPEGDPR